MFVIQKKGVKAIVMLAAVFLLPFPVLSGEKEIKIGYSSGSSSEVVFYFNVPVTEEMTRVIGKQEGVDSIFIKPLNRYEIGVRVAKMFSRKEVIDNIIKALEKEIFMGKIVKAYPMK